MNSVEAGAPPLPVPLRPLTLGDILDASISVLKERPRSVLAITAVFVVPVHVLAAYLQRDYLGGTGFVDIFNDPSLATTAAENQNVSNLASVVAVLGPTLALPFVAGALGRLVAAWYAGTEVTTGEALRSAGRRWWALLLAWFLTHVAEALGVFLIMIPTLLLMAIWQAAAPAIVVEGLGPIAGLRRSSALCTRRFGQMILAVLAAFWVKLAMENTLPLVPQLISLAVGLDVGWIFLAVGNSATALVTTAFLAGFSVFVYLDLRIRVEGLDLQLAADRHFARAG